MKSIQETTLLLEGNELYTNETIKGHLINHLSIIRSSLRGSSNCMNWSLSNESDALAYKQTTGFPILPSLRGLRTSISSLISKVITKLTTQTKAIKLSCKIAKLVLNYYGNLIDYFLVYTFD